MPSKPRPDRSLQTAWEAGRPATLNRRRPPSSVLSVRIPAQMLKELSQRAKAEGKTASEFARDLIEAGLSPERPETPDELAKAFTRWTREILNKKR